jgi:hypothetical protein
MRKLDGDACDDGDPTTGTSACQGGQCVGVATTVTVPPVVPAAKSAAKVRIPVQVQIPDVSGTKAAKVTLQGEVNCVDLPTSVRVKGCGQAARPAAGFRAQLISASVPITPLVKRNFGPAPLTRRAADGRYPDTADAVPVAGREIKRPVPIDPGFSQSGRLAIAETGLPHISICGDVFRASSAAPSGFTATSPATVRTILFRMSTRNRLPK